MAVDGTEMAIIAAVGTTAAADVAKIQKAGADFIRARFLVKELCGKNHGKGKKRTGIFVQL